MITALIVGLLLGFFLSMPPMGPTNFAIMSKGFKKQILEGVGIGTGAGFMDLVYILIAYGGLALFISFLPDRVIEFFAENELAVKVIGALLGSLVVMFYGISILRKKVKVPLNSEGAFSEDLFEEDIRQSEEVLHKQEEKLRKIFHKKSVQKNHGSIFFKNFMTGVVFCLSSITLPASWIAIVTYLKSVRILDSNFLTGFIFGFGVLVGTVIWFYFMVKVISRNANRIKPSTIGIVNKVVGVLLISLGAFLVVNVVYFAISGSDL